MGLLWLSCLSSLILPLAARSITIDISTGGLIGNDTPLVSLLLPAEGSVSPHLRARAIEQARAQTYPNIELVIVDDGDEASAGDIDPSDYSWVTFETVRKSEDLSLKLSVAAEAARGEIFILWNDMDISDPFRVESQARLIIGGFADVTVVDAGLVYDIESGSFFNGSSLYRFNLGTIAYTRRFADACNTPDMSLSDHNILIACLWSAGARVRSLPSSLVTHVQPNTPGAYFSTRATPVALTSLDANLQDSVDYFSSVGVLLSAGMLPPPPSPLSSLFSLPLPHRVPLHVMPLAWQPSPGGSNDSPVLGFGMWPLFTSTRQLPLVGTPRKVSTQSCGPSSFLSSNGSCATCSACTTTEFLVSPCTPSSDAVCQPCSPCIGDASLVAVCTSTTDTVCAVPEGHLSTLVASLAEQVDQSTLQTDMASLSTAQAYLDEVNLRTFPIPRLYVGNLTVVVNVSVASVADSDANKAATFLKDLSVLLSHANEADGMSGFILQPLNWSDVGSAVVLKLQNNTLQFLDNTTYLLETITGVVSKHASTQLTSLTAQEVSAAVSTVKSILIFPVDLLRVNDLHKLDYFVDAAVVATLPPGRVSSVTLTYVSTLYRWRSASAGQQSVWELGTA